MLSFYVKFVTDRRTHGRKNRQTVIGKTRYPDLSMWGIKIVVFHWRKDTLLSQGEETVHLHSRMKMWIV